MSSIIKIRWSALVAAMVVSAPAAFAQSTDASANVVQACVDHYGRNRIVKVGSACKRTEAPLQWNKDGPQGPAGPQGAAGADGAQGPQGPQGPAGADGAQGPQGLQGEPGPMGLPGLPGATGPQGAQGPAGADGATGAQGPKGDTGAAGPVGPAGPQGPAGGVITPAVTSAISSTPFTGARDNVWRAIPGLGLTVTLANASPVILAWNFQVSLNYGYMTTRLAIDGVVVPGTQGVTSGVQYSGTSGQYFATLAAGSHVIAVQYRSGTGFSFDPSQDWQAATLQSLAFDQ